MLKVPLKTLYTRGRTYSTENHCYT